MNPVLIPFLNSGLETDQTTAILAGHPGSPLLPPLGSLARFEFDKSAGCLVIADTFNLSRADAFETALISPHPFSIAEGQATVAAGGLTLAILPAPGLRAVRVGTLRFRNHDGKTIKHSGSFWHRNPPPILSNWPSE